MLFRKRLAGEEEGAAFMLFSVQLPAPVAAGMTTFLVVRAVVVNDICAAVGPGQGDVLIHIFGSVDLAENQLIYRVSALGLLRNRDKTFHVGKIGPGLRFRFGLDRVSRSLETQRHARHLRRDDGMIVRVNGLDMDVYRIPVNDPVTTVIK